MKNKKPLIEKILFLDNNANYAYFKNMARTLGRFCNKMIYFNRIENYFKYGKEEMNEQLLSLIKEEQPDYVFTWLTLDEFDLDSLLKIREISPRTKTVAIFGDDIIQFEDFSRYYALFFDYYFTTLKSYIPRYKKEGIKNIFLTNLTDTDTFKPIDLPKIYDVTFTGSKKFGDARYDYVNYLKDNGVNIRVFGVGWEDCVDLNDICVRQKNSDEIVNIINQSKINLCFSQTGMGSYQMKAKIFETNSCRAFTLCEYARDYLDYFKEGKEIIFFKTKEELLEKINFYLKHEKQREKIAKMAYQKTISKYSLFDELKIFFNSTRDKINHSNLPNLNEKVFEVTEKEISYSEEELKQILSGFDFVSFKKEDSEKLRYKDFLQMYSLKKTKKEVSCCNYYVYSKGLGDYLQFYLMKAFNVMKSEEFYPLIRLDQLMVTKDYFLRNQPTFKKIFNGEKIDFIKKDNTVFLNIPLVRLKKPTTKDYSIIKTFFESRFTYQLYSLAHKKRLFFNKYPYLLFLKSIRNLFILRTLLESILDKNIRSRIKRLN